MRCIQNNIRILGRAFYEDILHGYVANWRGSMKILLFDGAAETLELFGDVSLRAANPVAPCRVRSDGHKAFNVFVGAGAVESTRRFSGRSGNYVRKRGRRGTWCVAPGRGLVAASRHDHERRDTRRRISAETHSAEPCWPLCRS